jgi:hypothetical protein
MIIGVSLPYGLTDAAGRPVNRRPLSRGSGELFQPSLFIDRKPATLHFEIIREHVANMLRMGHTRASGNVTVIWDSEI